MPVRLSAGTNGSSTAATRTLISEDLVVVRLAAPAARGARGDPGVHDDVVVAGLVVAQEVLAAACFQQPSASDDSVSSWQTVAVLTKHHEVLRVVEVL